jgi:hypothetical protein
MPVLAPPESVELACSVVSGLPGPERALDCGTVCFASDRHDRRPRGAERLAILHRDGDRICIRKLVSPHNERRALHSSYSSQRAAA